MNSYAYNVGTNYVFIVFTLITEVSLLIEVENTLFNLIHRLLKVKGDVHAFHTVNYKVHELSSIVTIRATITWTVVP